MTTVAWDGHVLAVDSQVTSGDSIALYKNKLIKTNFGWLAGCGTLRDVLRLAACINASEGAIWPEGPYEPPTGLECTCFHITKDFFHRYESDGYAVDHELRAMACTGTGWEWARAALDHGCNAIQAVEYAKERDIYTGGEVNFIEIIPRHRRRK